jgi:WD40 repeat protein
MSDTHALFKHIKEHPRQTLKILHSLAAGLFLAASTLARRSRSILGPGLVLVLSSTGSLFAFDNTGTLATARSEHTATLLPNGKVLVVGGAGGSNPDGTTTYLASAELYDPANGTWTATGSLATARGIHTATLLPNGKVLVAGGQGTNNAPMASAELYDPATGTWTATGSLSTARVSHTATLLTNGKVLVVGNFDGSGFTPATAELYDPASGSWTATGSTLAAPRGRHTATLLPNGKVLIAGGHFRGDPLTSAELYDPTTGTWTATGRLAVGREFHTATLLPNGKVLAAGGRGSFDIPLASAELYDPANGTWTATGSLAAGREFHTATLLPNGKVLVAGGQASSYSTNAELYDPANGTWTTTGSLAVVREYTTATLLPNGKVLVAGGYDGNAALASCELYDPAATPTPTPSPTPTPTPTPTATPSPSPTPAKSLNISTRAQVQTGDNVMIGGFIVTGNTSKKVIVRAIGPSLAKSGLTNVLADPVLELHGPDGSLIVSDDNWRDNPDQALLIQASGLPPQDNLESAIVATLPPAGYTAIVSGKSNGIGLGLVEVYDLDQNSDSKLANMSTRAVVGTGNNVVIGGFILGGADGSPRIIIRAIGPSLAPLGVANPLADPTLELRDGNGMLIAFNDNWKDNPAQAAQIIAAGLSPRNDLESVIAMAPAPGAYTAIVAGKNGGVGVGLVEIYNLQ